MALGIRLLVPRRALFCVTANLSLLTPERGRHQGAAGVLACGFAGRLAPSRYGRGTPSKLADEDARGTAASARAQSKARFPHAPPPPKLFSLLICLYTRPHSCHTRYLALRSFLCEPHVNYSSATPTQWKSLHRPAPFPAQPGASSAAPTPSAILPLRRSLPFVGDDVRKL